MPDPIALTPVATTRAKATLNAEQITVLQQLLGNANLITFPDGKTSSDIVQLHVAVVADGVGFLSVSIK